MTTNQSETSTDSGVINIYFLAAPEDEHQCVAVKKYLSPVIRNSKRTIEMDSDFEIPPGVDVKLYKEKLFQADIVLAFISADFINDDDTYHRTQKVIERYNNNETVMLPILVRNCMWKSTPFVNLPLLPKNIQPLNNKQFWNSEDDALTAVVTDIYEAIEVFSHENPEESILVDVKVSELLADADVEEPAVAKQVTETDSVNTPKEPIQKEAKKAAPQPPKTKAKKINNVAMEVDWRKNYYKDTLGKRAVAFILDQIITAIPAMMLAFLLFFIFDEVINSPDLNEELSEDKFNFYIIFSLLFYFIICAIFESSKLRGTFGKRIMKLEISDREGNRISFIKAFFRNILRLFTGYSYFFIFPFIIQIFTFRKYRKLFHDQISYTVVGERTLRK